MVRKLEEQESKKMAAGTGHVNVGDPNSQPQNRTLHQLLAKWSDVKNIVLFLTFIAILFHLSTVILCRLVYRSPSRVSTTLSPPQLLNVSTVEPPMTAAEQEFDTTDTFEIEDKRNLARILKEASMKENKTVIVTMMNQAWAEPSSIFDAFLDGFLAGEGTERLLRHVVVVCLDNQAYSRCNAVHPRRCFLLRTPGVDFSGEKLFMVPDYLKMMWRRTEFLGSLLKLGYNFLFTDMDTMWLRDPFTRLFSEVDFQVAGDYYRFNGNSSDIRNRVNGGFNFVVANRKTVEFYNYWYVSRLRFPGKNEQVVLERIKHDLYIKQIGLTIRILDPVYFGNFCQLKWDITKVCIMHGNCCSGKRTKVKDLRQVLQDWQNYMSVVASGKADGQKLGFRKPMNCWRRGRRH